MMSNTNKSQVQGRLLPAPITPEQPLERGRSRTRGAARSRTDAARRAPHGNQIGPSMAATRTAIYAALLPPRLRSVSPPGAHETTSLQGSLESLSASAFDQHVPAAIKHSLVAEARRRERTLLYSTAAMVLAVCRKARRLEQQSHQEARFRDVRKAPFIAHQEVLDAYGGATCFTLCANLMEYVQRTYNLHSFALVDEAAIPTMAQWPHLTSTGTTILGDVRDHVLGVGHTDCAIPYTQDGVHRLLRLPTGQPLLSKYSDDRLSDRICLRGAGALLQNPHAMAHRALWGRYRMHMYQREKDMLFGIDLLTDELFINRKAYQAVTALSKEGDKSAEFQSRSFCFKDLVPRCSEPMAESAKRDWLHCLLYLNVIRRLFGLSNETLEDLVFLIDRRKNYLNDVVHPMAAVLKVCVAEHKRAIDCCESLDVYLRLKASSAAESIVEQANLSLERGGNAVQQLNSDAARTHYVRAYKQAQQAICVLEPRLTQDAQQASEPLGQLSLKLLSYL